MDYYQKYLENAIRFLSYRPRSEKEVRDNLLKKKASSEIIEQVIRWLKEQRFLNDEEFARWWVEQRTSFKPKGARIIKLELKQKGIAQDIIEAAFSHAETEEQVHLGMAKDAIVRNELDVAKEIVKKKLHKYKHLPKFEIYQKLGSHLARRGFDWDSIKSSIDDVLRDGV